MPKIKVISKKKKSSLYSSQKISPFKSKITVICKKKFFSIIVLFDVITIALFDVITKFWTFESIISSAHWI